MIKCGLAKTKQLKNDWFEELNRQSDMRRRVQMNFKDWIGLILIFLLLVLIFVAGLIAFGLKVGLVIFGATIFCIVLPLGIILPDE